MNVLIDRSLVAEFAEAFTKAANIQARKDQISELEIVLPVAFKGEEGFSIKNIKLSILAVDTDELNTGLPNAKQIAFLIPDSVVADFVEETVVDEETDVE